MAFFPYFFFFRFFSFSLSSKIHKKNIPSTSQWAQFNEILEPLSTFNNINIWIAGMHFSPINLNASKKKLNLFIDSIFKNE